MKFKLFFVFLILAACTTLVYDKSIPAVEANDKTLVMSACNGTPEVGFSACRVKEGQPIESTWRLFFPKGSAVVGGEVIVNFQGVEKVYNIEGAVLEIQWADFFQATEWSMDQDGTATAFAKITYKTDANNTENVKAIGEARVMVIKKGYDPLPIGSSFAAFTNTCTVTKEVCTYQYSTAGRAAVECK